jgi:hypothetical protein
VQSVSTKLGCFVTKLPRGPSHPSRCRVNGSGAIAETPQAECEEKVRLTRIHVLTNADYTRALQVLKLRAGVMRKADYDNLRGFAEAARRTAEEARAALDLHTAEHGC